MTKRTKRKLYQAVFTLFEQHNQQPVGELEYQSPFELLIAVVLSAQATDISVNKATKTLFAQANTPQAILVLGLNGLKAHIKIIGLYNNKAKHIMGLCQQLLDQYDGEVPSTLDELVSLPGVGRKTANVVLNMAFSQPTIAVDTHVYRVSRRLGLTSSNTVLGVEKALAQNIPSQFLLNAHHWLILHGRYICKARQPLCRDCFLSQHCQYFSVHG